MANAPTTFTVMVTGQIEYAQARAQPPSTPSMSGSRPSSCKEARGPGETPVPPTSALSARPLRPLPLPSLERSVTFALFPSPQVPWCDNAYCKYQVVHGEDWKFVDGQEDGITQVTRRSTGEGLSVPAVCLENMFDPPSTHPPTLPAGPDDSLVWNFPIDLTYNSTNVFGWPQVILTVFSVSPGGREQIIGYGCQHLPTCPGRSTLPSP